ncbi:MAG: hypothetical protein ACFCUQ_23020 [Kiloniellales bacterium]
MDRRALLSLALLAPAAALLGACDTPPRRSDFPDLTYQHLPKLRFDVREVEVVEAYRSPGAPPNVEHLFPVRPAAAAANWGRDRLVAAGNWRRLRYSVRDASAIEVPLKVSEGLTGAFKVEQSERYELHLTVELQVIGDTGLTEGTATVNAMRSVTVPEDITLHQRERVWFRLTEDVMKDLNAQLEKTLPNVLGQFLLS